MPEPLPMGAGEGGWRGIRLELSRTFSSTGHRSDGWDGSRGDSGWAISLVAPCIRLKCVPWEDSVSFQE